jgi:hypothetical protein
MKTAVIIFAVLLGVTGCASIKAAADCITRPDTPCPGDDMDPGAIPDARRLP